MCQKLHEDTEVCPQIKAELVDNPKILREVSNFAIVAAQHHLITSQTLDHIARPVNRVLGTNLSYEGTNQFVRDIQVFNRLNSDAYSRCGVFSNASSAKEYIDHANLDRLGMIKRKLTGASQEVDWLRWKQGQLSSAWEKSTLPNGNIPGYDGETISRLNGKTIEKTTIKAASGPNGMVRNVKDVFEAIKTGKLDPTDTLTGVKGTQATFNKEIDKQIQFAIADGDTKYANNLQKAKENLKIKEINSIESTNKSTERLMRKMRAGQAQTTITFDMAAKKICQGAIVGAAVSLTVSTISCYIKYKKGLISRQEAFATVGEEATKGLLIGGTMQGFALFLPTGPIGWVAGIAIGIYMNAVCTNFLDEVYGKGIYKEILDASGYVMGTSCNIKCMLGEFEEHVNYMGVTSRQAKMHLSNIDDALSEFERLKGEF